MKKISLERASIAEKAERFLQFSFDLLVKIHPLLRGMYTDAVRRDLLGNKLEAICRYIEDLFTLPDGTWFFYKGRKPETRRFNINITVSGVLFRISLASPEGLKAEIAALKKSLVTAITESSLPEVPA